MKGLNFDHGNNTDMIGHRGQTLKPAKASHQGRIGLTTRVPGEGQFEL
jgi:hypothetical protein